MRNGSALAVAEINARGGIGGRLIEQIVVDVDIFSAAGATRAFEMLFAAEVDAVTSGYVFTEDVAAGLAAGYGAPYLHAMTSQSQAETVRDNYAAFRNVFQVCPTEVNYGPGFIRFLSQARASGWHPRSRRIAVVQTALPSGQMLNPLTVEAAARSGWEIVAPRTVPVTGADWEAVVSDLERLDPAAVMIAQFLAGELAAFQLRAAARLPDALVYAIYAPSVPEFLQLAGPAAEGLVWATVTGTYDDSIGQRFRAGYQAAFGRPPGWSHAGIAYDEVYLLALAWRAVADPRDFATVSRELRQLRHRGVNGAYFLDNAEQSGLSFPDTTPDPSLGQAHLVLQVQDGTHRIISPAPYAEASFVPPADRVRRPRGTGPGPAGRRRGRAEDVPHLGQRRAGPVGQRQHVGRHLPRDRGVGDQEWQHPGRRGAPDPAVGVLDDHAGARLGAQPPGGQQEDVGSGLAAGHLIAPGHRPDAIEHADLPQPGQDRGPRAGAGHADRHPLVPRPVEQSGQSRLDLDDLGLAVGGRAVAHLGQAAVAGRALGPPPGQDGPGVRVGPAHELEVLLGRDGPAEVPGGPLPGPELDDLGVDHQPVHVQDERGERPPVVQHPVAVHQLDRRAGARPVQHRVGSSPPARRPASPEDLR